MSVQVEMLGKNMARMTIEVSEDKLEQAIQAAYMKQKNQISLPGFRKGKVPRKMIEKMYGTEIFFEEAANKLIQDNYGPAIDESGLDVVSRPEIDVTTIETGKPFVFTAEVAVKPEVTLGTYKGVTVTKIPVDVTDEEITDSLEKERTNNSRTITVEDRPVADGDTTVIDFEGFIDGVAFEGGKGENHSLEIGSHSFIDTFEDQLIGKNSGDELDVNVTFPENYQSADLAGKPAVFKVKINEIKAKELPELDDEFAQDVSEFDTLDEYKEDISKKLTEKKEADAKRIKEEEAIEAVIANAKMDVPEAMIDMQADNMVQEFAQRISQQGLTMEQYFQFTGMSVEKMKEQVRPDALKRIQSSLVLEQIANTEAIEVTDEEIDEELAKMAAQYGMEVDKIKEIMGDAEKESMKKDLSIQKAVDLIMDNVIEVEATEDESEEAEEKE
ncbi:MAG: trigger factor [Lachnospiraceae bacterium]